MTLHSCNDENVKEYLVTFDIGSLSKLGKQDQFLLCNDCFLNNKIYRKFRVSVKEVKTQHVQTNLDDDMFG